MSAASVQHVVTRLGVGGLEEVVRRASVGTAHLHVMGPAGLRAVQLRGSVAAMSQPRDLATLVRSLRGAQTVHVIQDCADPRPLVAACLAGAELVVATLHHPRARSLADLADHVFVPSRWAATGLDPERTSVVPEPLGPTPVLAPPWYAAGRPLRLVEVRRAPTYQAVSVESLLATGLLDRFDPQALVVGSEGFSDDPRVVHTGPVDDAWSLVAGADVLIRARPGEGYGRPFYEALGAGVLPAVLASAAYEAPADLWLALAPKPLLAAEALNRELERMQARPAQHLARRARAQEWVRQYLQVEERMQQAWARAQSQASVGRSIYPEDVPEPALEAFSELLDARQKRSLARIRARDLPGVARALWRWLRSRTGGGASTRRIERMSAAREYLGDRPTLLLDLGRCLQEAGAVREAEIVAAEGRRLRGLPSPQVSSLRTRSV